jgi:imidazolonepropionase-like amidohydrolase
VDVDRWNPQTDLRHKDLADSEIKYRKIRLHEESKNVGRMKKAGVEILAGTDLGNPFIFPGFSLHDELELLVKAGLSAFEALQTATVNPSRFFGMQDSLGTIEKGKIADMVLLDANPLENISNTKKIFAVIINGKLLQRKDLDQMLDKVKELTEK